MAGFYRPRHPERTVLYRVLSHHFERFLAAYERCLEEEYGYFRRNVREVVERYLDCGNPQCGFTLMIRCRLMRTAKRCPHPVSGLRRRFPGLLTSPRGRRYSIDMVRRGASLPTQGEKP